MPHHRKPHSAATRRKIAQARLGRKLSRQTRAKIGAGVQRGLYPRMPFGTRVNGYILDVFCEVVRANKDKIARVIQRGMVSYLLEGFGQSGKARFDMKRTLGICLYCLDEARSGYSCCPKHLAQNAASKRHQRS